MNPNMILNMLLSKNPTIQNNPIMQNAMSMLQNGNGKGIKTLAENLAKEKGIDINGLKRQIESNLQI